MTTLRLWIVFLLCFPAFFLAWGVAWLMIAVTVLALVVHVLLAIRETRP